jgi:nucleotide-binding universal stress UspA family protein
VIEPVKTRQAARIHVPTLEADRRAVAEDRMAELLATIPPELQVEGLVAYGDPSEELAKIVQDRHAGLIIIGLHSSPVLGPRMGSVTYRVLCLSPTLTLALPVEHSEGAGPSK